MKTEHVEAAEQAALRNKCVAFVDAQDGGRADIAKNLAVFLANERREAAITARAELRAQWVAAADTALGALAKLAAQSLAAEGPR